LNSLIAIISDSYEKCLLQSKQLFGSARIRFLGDTLAFQNLYVKLDSPAEQKHWTHGGYTFLVTSCMLYAGFVWFEYSMIVNDSTLWVNVSFALCAWIVICFNVVLAQQVDARKKRSVGLCPRIFDRPIKIIQRIIQLIQGTGLYYNSSIDGPEGWGGRVLHLKREMNRLGEEQSKEISNLNSKLKKVEEEVKKSEEKVVEILRTILSRLDDIEKRNRRIES